MLLDKEINKVIHPMIRTIFLYNFQIFESQQPLRIGYYVNDGYLTSIPAVEKAVHIAKTILEQKGHKVSQGFRFFSRLVGQSDPWSKKKWVIF